MGKKNKGQRAKFRTAMGAGDFPDAVGAGRHNCTCRGTKHKVLYNCLNCGNVVCEQQGDGECLFCGARQSIPGRNPQLIDSLPVETPARSLGQQLNDMWRKKQGGKALPAKSRQASSSGAAISKALSSTEAERAKDEAARAKDKLVLFDRTMEQRTVVIDDQQDYYRAESNVWLTEEERQEARRQEQARRERAAQRSVPTFAVDFAGRITAVEEELAAPAKSLFGASDSREQKTDSAGAAPAAASTIGGGRPAEAEGAAAGARAPFSRVQHDELQGL